MIGFRLLAVPATFAVGCERYPEGAVPTEIKERPEGTKIDDLTFWSI
jgi:hypothetical protein